MGIIAVVGYKPKKGQAATLRKLMESHISVLKKEDLVTERDSIVMEAQNGTIIEVFEWKSQEAIEKAHSNRNVIAMWDEYAEVCDYVPVASIPETSKLFSEFKPVN